MSEEKKELYNPFEELPACVCPQCFKPAMAYREDDTVFALVDADGLPGNFVCNTQTVFHCLECGFTSTDYILTESGWRYNPHNDEEYIKEKNKRLKETKVWFRNPREMNPFVAPEPLEDDEDVL